MRLHLGPIEARFEVVNHNPIKTIPSSSSQSIDNMQVIAMLGWLPPFLATRGLIAARDPTSCGAFTGATLRMEEGKSQPCHRGHVCDPLLDLLMR